MQDRGNFTTVIYDGTLLSKNKVKQFGFFFEICSKSIFLKNWWNNGGIVLLLWKDFSTANMFWNLWMVPFISSINENDISR